MCLFFSVLSCYPGWIGSAPSICALDSTPSTTKGFSSCSNSSFTCTLRFLSLSLSRITPSIYKHTATFLILEALTGPHVPISLPFLCSPVVELLICCPGFCIHQSLFTRILSGRTCQGYHVARLVANPQCSSCLPTSLWPRSSRSLSWDIFIGISGFPTTSLTGPSKSPMLAFHPAPRI